MSVDIGWCNEISFCIHFYVRGFIQMLYNSGNAATTDADIPGPGVLSETGVSNDQVHACVLHRVRSLGVRCVVLHSICTTPMDKTQALTGEVRDTTMAFRLSRKAI